MLEHAGIKPRKMDYIIAKARKIGLSYQGKPKGLFRSGHTPHNKGKKMPQHVREKVTTMFQPGHTPANTRHDGCISLRDTKRLPTLYIRLGTNKWVNYARYIWEQANGPIPAGHIVIHTDGDRMNCSLDNLQIISRRENMARNRNVAKAAKTMKQKAWPRRKMRASGTTSFVDAVLQGLL